MITFTVTANGKADIADAYDLVRRGLLSSQFDLVEIKGENRTPGPFSAGDCACKEFKATLTAKFPEIPDDEQRAYIVAKVKEIVGDLAVIRFESCPE